MGRAEKGVVANISDVWIFVGTKGCEKDLAGGWLIFLNTPHYLTQTSQVLSFLSVC